MKRTVESPRTARWALLLVAGVGGCAVGPTPQAPAVQTSGIDTHFRQSLDGLPVTTQSQWWSGFADPTLQSLIDTAMVANTDLEVATQRMRQARASLVAARGGLLPTLGFSAGRTRTAGDGPQPAVETTSASLTANYEFDLFGGHRRAVTAAAADRRSAAESRRSVQISLAAEVAINYVSAVTAADRLRLAQANLAAQQETLQIVRWRAMAGLAGDVEVAQAVQLAANTQAGLPDLQQTRDAALNRLATLTGESASRVAARVGNTTTVAPAPFPDVALPYDVLRQRPDVRVAEASVVAELARVGVRESAVLPALTLGGSIGGVGRTWSAATTSPTVQLTALLAGSLFRGGQDWAAVESQKAAAAVATANYRGVVRTAIEELENAIGTARAVVAKETALTEADAAATQAVSLARLRYQSGLIDFQSLLDAERTALSSQLSLAQAHADRALAAIRLYKALGGGWPTSAGTPTASETSP
jgi:NodT family efflux transporter outer membrane factor (OMF) lipoprotein